MCVMKLVFFLESTKRFDDNRKQAKTIDLNYPTQDGIQGLKKIGTLHQDSDQTKFILKRFSISPGSPHPTRTTRAGLPQPARRGRARCP